MDYDFLKQASALSAELYGLREEFHRDPELGNREFHTANRIEQYLRSCGIETARILDTAVVGTLRGALPGKTVALRADMDALPVQEQTQCAFCSKADGIMHACGHDVHMAAVLGAAKLLSRQAEGLRGTVKFFFEPDEEGRGGAQRMIFAGCMDQVGAVFGAHVSPELPAGSVGVRYGKFYAAADTFTVVVQGKSAHGAQPEKGIDALAAAAEMVTELRKLPHKLAPERCVLSIGRFGAGSAGNIIADRAEFSGIIRSLGAENRTIMQQNLRETLNRIAAKTKTGIELQLLESYAGIVNSDAETQLVQDTAAALLGQDAVTVLREPVMMTEDFGCFTDASSGSFYHIGGGCEVPLHNPKFLPDAAAVVTAAALHAAVAAAYLKNSD